MDKNISNWDDTEKKIQNGRLTSVYYTYVSSWGGGVLVRMVIGSLIMCDYWNK